MAYSVVPTVATGDLWTAANHNTYIRDNFAAGVPDIFEAKGDLAVASAANAASKLTVGSNDQLLVADSVEILGMKWADIGKVLIKKRQGGHTTNWDVSGTTVYDVENSLIQVGTTSIPLSGSTTGGNNITYPIAFKYNPLIIVGAAIWPANLSTVYPFGMKTSSRSATGFRLDLYFTNSVTDAYRVSWIAIGEKNV